MKIEIVIEDRWVFFTGILKEASQFELLYLDPNPLFTAEMIATFTGRTNKHDV